MQGIRRRGGLVERLLLVLVDNHLLSTTDAAVLLNSDERTIGYIRSSDSFKSLLAKAVEARHGEAIRTVRSNTLHAANEALNTTVAIMRDAATLPTVKLEAAKIALDNFAKSEERAIPKGPAGQPTQNVTINLTFEELSEARQAALQHGETLELEASDAAHAPQIPGPRGIRDIPGITSRRE